MILLYWITLCTVFFHWWGQLGVECVHTEGKICGVGPVVTYLIEMWFLKHGKCIYLDSNMTFYILVSLCGFKHCTSNGERTSRMTSQDLSSASQDSLPSFPRSPWNSFCTAALWWGSETVGAVCSISLNLQWGTHLPRAQQRFTQDTRSSVAGEGGLKGFLRWGVAPVPGSVSSVFNHRLAAYWM